MSVEKPVEQLERVVIRFAGDSGDGMQLTGDRFTSETAVFGNDLATLPDFPAEIRAPAGSLPGVSGFQVHFADHDILTPGDQPSVLVAMNPAALKVNLGDLAKGGTVILNTDAFSERNLQKAGYASNPLEDGSLADYHVHEVALSSMTIEALKGIEGVTSREAERSKNFFALGLMSWLYHRPIEGTLGFIERKFAQAARDRGGEHEGLPRRLELRRDVRGLRESRTRSRRRSSSPARTGRCPGTRRSRTGSLRRASCPACRSSWARIRSRRHPTSSSSSRQLKQFGVRTFQAEDEIAASGAALGAAFGGALGVTTSAGPGIVLKSETVGLAVTLELPLVVVDVQRAGPSTGMPTKPEQADLLMVMFGRNSESPVPVVAASTPSGCFDAAIEAARIAIKYRTPVFLLSDAYLANGSEPWRIPDVAGLPDISTEFAVEPNDGDGFLPYRRDPETLARPWALPGTPGLEHRIGGLEKEADTGNVSYDPENHDLMVQLRAAKVAGIAADIAPLDVDDPDGAETLVLGWGSTHGAIGAAARRVRATGRKVATAHLHHLNPFPANTEDVVGATTRC